MYHHSDMFCVVLAVCPVHWHPTLDAVSLVLHIATIIAFLDYSRQKRRLFVASVDEVLQLKLQSALCVETLLRGYDIV